jgi:hypothetical protein
LPARTSTDPARYRRTLRFDPPPGFATSNESATALRPFVVRAHRCRRLRSSRRTTGRCGAAG